MVERDRREHGDLPVCDIRGIPLAAHADLEHHHVDRRVGEDRERQHGQRLEEGEGSSSFAISSASVISRYGVMSSQLRRRPRWSPGGRRS
jgi:hypothetical protein